MKRLSFIGIVAVFFIGCANTQPHPKKIEDTKLKTIESFVKGEKIKNPTKIIAKNLNKPVDVKEVKKVLLKTNPIYAEKNKRVAVKENFRLSPNMPLYRPPRFAEMYVMPYVSSDGIYHDTQKVWIKIKDGEFVLNTNQKGNTNPRVFNPLGE